TRRRINHFHTLIKEYSKLASKRQARGNDLSAEDMVSIGERIEDVSREMAQMGGLDWYQKASLLGQCKQRGGDTSRWLVPKMRDLGVDKRPGKTRLLDVGALSCLNYAKERKWIDVTPIDLNSQEPGIYKQDFLDIELDSNAPVPLFPFEVICLSLVVNFIGDPARRGDMLKQAARLLAPEGLLFLVLPLSCVANSRYLDDERLLEIMQFLGFTQLHQNHTAKLAHYLYRLTASIPATASASGDEPQFKKKMLHSAPGRNNFSIVV
ncbi:hypothetical protein BX661DRAFT_124983, partial [Kickxella alabastrina]|uniref:uncharacterized protein n=1 Tax=Kickxella alabastrina TaxID=61397 RepID=UPI00221E4B33